MGHKQRVFNRLPPLVRSCLSFSHSSPLFSRACSFFAQKEGGMGATSEFLLHGSACPELVYVADTPCSFRRFATNSPCIIRISRLNLKGLCALRVPRIPQGDAYMATSVWKGYLTFGLISIPIRLFSAARGERIGLNQLHSVCHSRIKMPLFCPVCDRKVERNEIVKGYEYEKDQYVLFDEKELEKIEPESARSMEILEFVRLDEIDPLYYESSYYVTPEDEGRKAYQLLLDAMEESGYAAIAKITMHQREHIVVIRPRENGMTLHTMFYTNEIREVAEYGKRTPAAEPKDAEKKLATQLIESLAAKFEPEKYKDQYQEA
jgi:DNA end-binding protein Ku